MRHIVMFSGGIGSAELARRVVAEQGTDAVTLLFSDVKGDSDDPHVGEDEDTYRFIYEVAGKLGAELVHLREGRNIWQVFKDDRFLGNTRLANCSKFLKQRPARAWLDENCDPEDTTIYVGIDWQETHRRTAVVEGYQPFSVAFPLCDEPFVLKSEMLDNCREWGVEPPRAYALGFPHNNCGGGCVRAGQSQFSLLLQVNPERYAAWEKNEEEVRQHLGKDVAILRDRRGGVLKPMTLRAFRERVEAKQVIPDQEDYGYSGCGCFVSAEEK
jgi:hypothetical protein